MDLSLVGYSASCKIRLLTPELAQELSSHLPERMQLRPEWRLKYSLEQHGSSLRTLYSQALPQPGDHHQHGYMLVVRDGRNGLLGAYTSEPLRPSDGRYRGNGDCFLWKLAAHGHPTAYSYTGANDFMVFCTQHFLSFGGGDGHYGLWIDDSLEKGVTYPSLTYNNEVLSSQGSKFDVLAVELWEI